MKGNAVGWIEIYVEDMDPAKSKFSIAQYGYITIGYDTEGNMLGLHSVK